MIALAWIIFAAVLVGLLLLSLIIVKYYQEKREAEALPTVVAVLGLTVTLLCIFLIPVDIYNASSSSGPNGEAILEPSQIAYRGNIIRTLYYSLYGIVLCLAFGVIPFAYFYYEEFDEEVTIKQRVWAGCKYTIFLLIIVAILMVVGLVLFLVKPGDKPSNGQDLQQWIEQLLKDTAKQNVAEAAIGFSISSLTVIGYLCWLTYTAYGLSIFPIGTIRGRKHVLDESTEIRDSLEKTRKEESTIKSRYLSGSKKMSKKDEAKVSLLKRKERALNRQHERLKGTQTWYRHIWAVMRPFMFLFGFVFLLISLLIVVSIVLTNADKAINAIKVCGAQCGFVDAYPKLFRPLDSLLTLSAKFFPLDYVIISLLILYIFFATLSGISNIGVRFLWVHLFKVKRGSTPPQGILFACIILMLSLMALNMEISTLAPQYATFGTQVFMNETSNKVQPCTIEAAALLANSTTVSGTCVLTQIGTIVNRISVGKTFFFGVIYYFISWAFVLFFIIGSIVACVKSKPSNIDRRESDSDEDES